MEQRHTAPEINTSVCLAGESIRARESLGTLPKVMRAQPWMWPPDPKIRIEDRERDGRGRGIGSPRPDETVRVSSRPRSVAFKAHHQVAPVNPVRPSTRDSESSRGFRRTHAETPGVLTGWL